MSFGLIALGLAACDYIPRAVEGVPPDAPWEALPLRKWLAEDRAEPHALAFCAPPECRPGLVVSVIDLKGRDAIISEALLKDPARLTRALQSGPNSGRNAQATISATPMKWGSLSGFAIALSPADERKTAYGATLGRRSGETLKLVLVVGEDETAVLETTRKVADAELSP